MAFPVSSPRGYATSSRALDGGGARRRPNLSAAAQRYLDRLGLGVEDLFHHALAVLHDPAYREANAGALRMEWPRIPLPGWPEDDAPDARRRAARLRRPGLGAGRAAGPGHAGAGRDRRYAATRSCQPSPSRPL